MTGNLAQLAATLGAGVCVTGASLGIGRLAASFMEGTARQPGAASSLRTGLMISMSFIEGLGMFGLLICMIVGVRNG
jgi:F-type H+-transporting ATPase subunit c